MTKGTSLSLRGYGVPLGTAGGIDALKAMLVVKPRNAMMTEDEVESFPVYIESSKKIYIPKALGLARFGVPERNTLPEADHIDLDFVGSLRAEQRAPADAFMKAAHDPLKRGGILNLPCGFGKTCLALYVVSQLKVKTLIVVHKEFLLDQWRERIGQFLPTAKVGLIKGPKCITEDKDIVIASLQSLAMKKYAPEVFAGFGLTIFDEVHHTAAKVFSRVFHNATTLYTLGLSATLTRKDGLTRVFKWHIGDVVFKARGAREETATVLAKDYYDPAPAYSQTCTMWNKKPNISRMINNICAYRPRIDFMLDVLAEVLAEEPLRKVLMLSDRRQHLQDLQVALTERGIESGFYYGGLRQEVLQESEGKQVLLGTYAYVSEGFDMRGLNTMVLASPKSDVVQSVGRIFRDKPEDREYAPLIIDIIDKFSLFPNQARKRLTYYKQQGYDVKYDETKYHLDPADFSGKCCIRDEET